MKEFAINIISQNWITDYQSEIDLCSHGQFQLIINGKTIIHKNEKLNDWTVSTSVLKLLRCIDNDHNSEKDYEVIMHCGQLLMLGCPIGIYWELKHENNKIVISNIRKVLSTDDSNTINYDDLKLEIEQLDFAIEILKCAEQVKIFFKNEPKREFETDEDLKEWNSFWAEFDLRYNNGIEKFL